MATTRTLWQRAVHDWLPVVVVLLAVVIAWYVAAWALNAPGAIERVLDPAGGGPRTPDLGGSSSTQEVGRAIAEAL